MANDKSKGTSQIKQADIEPGYYKPEKPSMSHTPPPLRPIAKPHPILARAGFIVMAVLVILVIYIYATTKF